MVVSGFVVRKHACRVNLHHDVLDRTGLVIVDKRPAGLQELTQCIGVTEMPNQEGDCEMGWIKRIGRRVGLGGPGSSRTQNKTGRNHGR